LDREFCDDNLPSDEQFVLLEDADGDTWEVIYKPVRGALSGGWRAFSIDHGLDAGDAAKFEVVDKVCAQAREPQKESLFLFSKY
jgi:hypothetical protein